MANESDRSNQEVRRHLGRFKITGAGISIICFLAVIYLLTNYPWQAKTAKERQATALKVKTVMRLFNCTNQKIYAAIMDTFDPLLVAIIIGVESEYRPEAVSRAGCRGLMQLSPDKLSDWRDVTKNIRTGSSFLKEQLNRFGSIELAIAAYNAGPESIVKFKGVPPYRETVHYLNKTRALCSVYYPELFVGNSPKVAAVKYQWHDDSSFAQAGKSGLFDPVVH